MDGGWVEMEERDGEVEEDGRWRWRWAYLREMERIDCTGCGG